MSKSEQDVNITSDVTVNEQDGGKAIGVAIGQARDVIIYSGEKEGAERRPQSFEPEMVPVPAGSYSMGDDEDDVAAPRHVVELPAYRIGRRPVTNAQFHYYLQHTGQSAKPGLRWENGTSPSREQEEQPVSGVTWHEALAYCTWLFEETKRAYCLPSEAQWERAVCEETDPPLDWGELREWTTTLWGEKRRTPDERYLGSNDLLANDQVRRVTRGRGSRPTKRTSERPTSRGLTGNRIGFRVVISQEG